MITEYFRFSTRFLRDGANVFNPHDILGVFFALSSNSQEFLRIIFSVVVGSTQEKTR